MTGKFGRQKPYFIGPTLFIICSIGQFWVQSGYALFIYRFFIGVAVGIEYPVATALLVEFLPKKSRGPLLAMLTIMWFAGAAVAYLVGDMILRAGGEDAWRYILASTAIIGLLLFLVRLGTPESPRWLIAQGKIDEAEKVIKKSMAKNIHSIICLNNRPSKKSRSLICFIQATENECFLFPHSGHVLSSPFLPFMPLLPKFCLL
nr:MFS transporter [Bartonella apihabitans]